MAYLADWVLETASNPGTNATVNLAGAVIGPFKSFASSFANGDKVFYTISDETAARETGVGTFTAGAPNSISRDTVTANTLGTTSRLNFIGAVFVWCSVPAAKAAYYDATGGLAPLGNIKIPNGVALQTVDTFGAAHNTLKMETNNTVIIEQGSGGFNIDDVGAANTLWSINPNGVVSHTLKNALWDIKIAPIGNAFTATERSGGSSTAFLSDLNLTTSFHMDCLLNGVNKGSISQVSTTGVAFNTVSDQTLKINDGEIPPEDCGSIIDRLKPRWFRWKSAPDGHSEPGFFAQEVQRIYAWAVTKGRGRKGSKDYMPWQMDQAKLMPVVVAELKALRARVAELERQNSGTECWKGI